MSGKKRKTTTTVEEIVPTDGALEEDTPPEMNFNLEDVREAEQLEEIASQFPNAGITVKLYDEDAAYCLTIPDPKRIDEELIRKRCGHGKFTLRIYINGKYRHYIPLPIREIQPDSSVTTPNSTRNGDSSNSHSDFLEKQAQRNHELLLAAISSTRSAGPSITDLTTALANIDSLRGKQETGVDLIMKGIDLAQRFSGDTDWKTDLIRMGKDVLPKIADGVTAVMGLHRNGSTQQIQPTVTNVETQAQTEEQLPSAEAIRVGIAYLKRKCLNGVDPDLIIDWIVPNADEYQGLIRVILNKDFSEFAQYDIEIGSEPYLGWFRKLFDGLRSAFSSADSVDDSAGGLVGNEDNIRDNGKSRQGRESKSEGPKASA